MTALEQCLACAKNSSCAFDIDEIPTPCPYRQARTACQDDSADAELAGNLAMVLCALLAEHAEMNAELRALGRGRPQDGSHPDCPADMARVALAKVKAVTP
jgi:hypothetical protein